MKNYIFTEDEEHVYIQDENWVEPEGIIISTTEPRVCINKGMWKAIIKQIKKELI